MDKLKAAGQRILWTSYKQLSIAANLKLSSLPHRLAVLRRCRLLCRAGVSVHLHFANLKHKIPQALLCVCTCNPGYRGIHLCLLRFMQALLNHPPLLRASPPVPATLQLEFVLQCLHGVRASKYVPPLHRASPQPPPPATQQANRSEATGQAGSRQTENSFRHALPVLFLLQASAFLHAAPSVLDNLL